jgi:hypothetical protein
VNDLPEAKWCDLLDKQKRRLFECFGENEHLEFGYAKFTRTQLQSIGPSHLIYQDVEFPPAWDVALEGWAYGEILMEMGANHDQRPPVFEFDRMASKSQSVALCDHVREFVKKVDPFVEGSRKSKGIQAADCFAGAVAEDYSSDTNWLKHIDDDRIVECSPGALIQLQHKLVEYDSEP